MTITEVTRSAAEIALNERWGATNYAPLPVVVASGSGTRVVDVDGRGYLDFLAGYSALNFGHGHPVLVEAAHRQLDRLTLTSRAFHNDRLGGFTERLARLARTETGVGSRRSRRGGDNAVLPMNTGAEAVETGIKVARAWGYRVRGVPDGRARIIVASGNFHGRTTTIVGFSDDPAARDGFGPFTPGFDAVPFGDAAALEAAITEDTVAVLLEPIQGEAGVVVPPPGYLAAVRRITERHGVLLVADEIQCGLGRTGTTFRCEADGVTPDLMLLGKALGGGIVPVSAVVGRSDVLGVLRPGEHGSTFGGNPLAAAVGSAVVGLLETGEYQERARTLGAHLHARLGELVGHGLTAVRGAGLWAGIDIEPDLGTGRRVCELLAARGVLAKDTHGSTLRLAPPLVVERAEIDEAVEALAGVLTELRR